ncbi:hypothetical protein AZA_10046 [Nitrospirillum viridazoti Y2]|nr:hypothetical protein AZA_10046 [Nitrospirillum amazonense Y2]
MSLGECSQHKCCQISGADRRQAAAKPANRRSCRITDKGYSHQDRRSRPIALDISRRTGVRG